MFNQIKGYTVMIVLLSSFAHKHTYHLMWTRLFYEARDVSTGFIRSECHRAS